MTRKLKILVADDDGFVRDVLREILQANDYLVDCVENGSQALEKVCADPDIKLVLSDMNMPEMSGLELTKKISQKNMDIPIIILTGSGDLEIAVNAINNGASDFLLKDENIQDTVVPSVRRVLEKQQMKEALARKNEELAQFNETLENTIKKLTEITTGLSSETNFPRLLEMIVSEARHVTNADGGTLYILEENMLQFMILQNRTMGTFLGGASGNPITLPPVPLVESNVSAYCALKKEIINIPDVYESMEFDFAGTKKYDAETNYRSESMLVLPLLDRDKDIIGVLQLINSMDPKTGEIVSFAQNTIQIVNSLACQAAVCIENARSYEKIERKNIAFQRFVPSEFLRCLGKKEVEDIGLGDASHEEMSVLFADIRSFASLSESMTPEENFLFLNGYLKFIAPTITRSGGFVDKFIGDAIMVLFPGSCDGVADDAVQAAVAMQEKVKEYNENRKNAGYRPIAIGIGVHTGPLTLGTIGFETRVESTVVGDTVNLSSRLESLTKRYGVSTAISSVTYERLHNPAPYLVRELDTVQVKGKERPVTIYEIFNSDPDTDKEKKIQIMGRYNEGILLYKQGNWGGALQLFTELREELRTDKTIGIYVDRCRSMLANPPDASWNGVTRLDEK